MTRRWSRYAASRTFECSISSVRKWVQKERLELGEHCHRQWSWDWEGIMRLGGMRSASKKRKGSEGNAPRKCDILRGKKNKLWSASFACIYIYIYALKSLIRSCVFTGLALFCENCSNCHRHMMMLPQCWCLGSVPVYCADANHGNISHIVSNHPLQLSCGTCVLALLLPP